MKSYKLLTVGIVVAVSAITTSCVKDLETKPIDPNVIASSNLGDHPEAMRETLAKLYSSFAVPGQDGVSGASDISGIDAGFGVYTRALWMLQELSTDEALCAWNDQTIKDYHWQTWSSTDVFNAAMYSRIIYTVSICNEFIRNTNESSDPTVMQYNAEARFLRALAYYHAIDMYGNPAFITEADKPGSFYPKQITRAKLFEYIESELKDIENKLGEPRSVEYGRADRAAAWMLLARLYLNAEVYIGTPKYTECITYCNKVIGAGYTLAPDYRWNFSADNNTSPEMIFAINYDGMYTQSYGGTAYIIHAATGGDMNAAALGIGSGWGGNRTTKDFANILIDTIAHPISTLDVMFSSIPDKRVYLQQLTNWNIYNVGTFTDGIGVRKFTNMNHDGTPAIHPHNDFPCTDYPIFRLADAYLMYAEAVLRGGAGGTRSQALTYINDLRDRAYGNTSGEISDAQLTLPFILDERGREMYWEGVRRTDLIRFGEFTTASYLWQWKGNVMNGQATESYRNLFPIPASEVAANPNIKQNPGYN